jgi:formylmethanofuran dehydrogenase subunit C
MRNPFLDFGSLPYQKKKLPLERIVQAKEETMDRIVQGYLHLVEEEVKDLVWLVEHSRVVKAYSAAVKSIRELEYDSDDVDEFCSELDSSKKIPYMISGPAGIYVSALVNHVQEDRIVLRLKDYQRTFHFLGYRLPEGKTLVLQGDVGDFIGAGLSGGRLVAEGSTGNWCGAGMMKGEIIITEHTGQNTGEWMRGGEIHVDGRIRSVGKTLFGGRIYQKGKLLVPQDLAGEF